MTTIQIKKAGQDPQIINVPEGAKIIIEDGITIVEPKFKNGDIVFGSYNGNSWIGIFNKYINNNAFNYHARICSYSLEYSDYVSIGLAQRHATESEKQLLFDALAKDGKQWNPETKQIEELKSKFNELGYEYNFETHTAEKLRWVPKIGEEYYYPTLWSEDLYRKYTNTNTELDNICIANKLAFKTPEEAIEVSKRWLQQ